MPFLKITDIQTRNQHGDLYIEFAVWRNQADHDGGAPPVHRNDWIMPVNRFIRNTDQDGNVQRASDGAWITPAQADEQELGRNGIIWRRKTRAEVRATVLRRLRRYILEQLPGKLQRGERQDQRLRAEIKSRLIGRDDPNDILGDADTLKGYAE